MAELADDEISLVLASARALKALGVNVAWTLEKMARSEAAVSPHFPIRIEPWGPDRPGETQEIREVDAGRLCAVLRSLHGAQVDVDAIYSPTVLEQLSSMRATRAYFGLEDEGHFWQKGDLDRAGKAITLRNSRGRPPIAIREQVQDRADYGEYIRIRAVLAKETGAAGPKLGKRAETALWELAFTREQFEPFFSEQLAALRADSGRARLSVGERAALVLLGLRRKRQGATTAIDDSQVEEAVHNVERLEKSLKRFAVREKKRDTRHKR